MTDLLRWATGHVDAISIGTLAMLIIASVLAGVLVVIRRRSLSGAKRALQSGVILGVLAVLWISAWGGLTWLHDQVPLRLL